MSEKVSALVVDDDNDARSRWKRFLTIRGFSCRTAATQREALKLLANGFFPEVALVDYLLPSEVRVDNKVEALSHGLTGGMSLVPDILLVTGGLCRIVVMTGLHDYLEQASESGSWGYCEKPIPDFEGLVALLLPGILKGHEIGAPTKDLGKILKTK